MGIRTVIAVLRNFQWVFALSWGLKKKPFLWSTVTVNHLKVFYDIHRLKYLWVCSPVILWWNLMNRFLLPLLAFIIAQGMRVSRRKLIITVYYNILRLIMRHVLQYTYKLIDISTGGKKLNDTIGIAFDIENEIWIFILYMYVPYQSNKTTRKWSEITHNLILNSNI